MVDVGDRAMAAIEVLLEPLCRGDADDVTDAECLLVFMKQSKRYTTSLGTRSCTTYGPLVGHCSATNWQLVIRVGY